MLLEAMQRFGARPADTPFVGDQRDDLEAAAKARCPRVLVRSGNGRATEEEGYPNTVQPVEVHDDLPAFVDHYLGSKRKRRGISRRREPPPLFMSRKIRDY
jgi:D-glycero-D-manno-heptose 1,7-bisphosphate phosphatase